MLVKESKVAVVLALVCEQKVCRTRGEVASSLGRAPVWEATFLPTNSTFTDAQPHPLGNLRSDFKMPAKFRMDNTVERLDKPSSYTTGKVRLLRLAFKFL